MRRILICGAAGALGELLSRGIGSPGDELWLSSRRRPESLELEDGVNRLWCPADLSRPSDVDEVRRRLVGSPLHGLIYSAGTWETDADIARISSSEIYYILSVNTAAFLALALGLRDSLARSGNGRVIAIGSTCGLENATGSRAVYAASKFGLRGAVHGLRHYFRELPIGVTALSPGPMGSDPGYEDGSLRIPAQDVLRVIRTLFELSTASIVTEIHMHARLYDDVGGRFLRIGGGPPWPGP